MTEEKYNGIEKHIAELLKKSNIQLFSIFPLLSENGMSILIGLESVQNTGITPDDVKNCLVQSRKYQFDVPREFERRSGAFLHMEIGVSSVR